MLALQCSNPPIIGIGRLVVMDTILNDARRDHPVSRKLERRRHPIRIDDVAARRSRFSLAAPLLVFGGCGAASRGPRVPHLGIGFVGVALAFGLTVS